MSYNAAPSDHAVQRLLAELRLPSDDVAVTPMAGDHSNGVHLITVGASPMPPTRLVLKTYRNPKYDRDLKARREFRALDMLHDGSVPTPKPIYLDNTGTLMGSPSIVTSFVDGEEPSRTDDLQAYSRAAATMLASIHRIEIGARDMPALMDGNAECVWFLKHGIPDYMTAHPQGEFLWCAVRDLYADATPTPTVLLHTDFWTANVLWDGQRILAVLDWEEAAYGDPCIDVAYTRMDMYLNGMGRETAGRFLREYEVAAGRAVENLALWELAAAVRPMYEPEWEAECRDELLTFIADARTRAGI